LAKILRIVGVMFLAFLTFLFVGTGSMYLYSSLIGPPSL